MNRFTMLLTFEEYQPVVRPRLPLGFMVSHVEDVWVLSGGTRRRAWRIILQDPAKADRS